MIENDILYNDLNVDSPKIIQDQRIMIKLKEHQKTAIHAMIEFENNGKVIFNKRACIRNYIIYDELNYKKYYNDDLYDHNYQYVDPLEKYYKNMCFEIETNYGILADKVGSGKTFMTMGLISYKQIPPARDRIISSSIYTVTKYKDMEIPKKTNLIIVPHNLILQWKAAFNNCTLKTFSIVKKSDIEQLVFEENIFLNEKPCSDADFTELNCIEYYDVLIISATMFDDFYKKHDAIKWARIIIDEVVSIKLPADLEFKCNFIWFLTATPSGIKYVRKNYIRTLITSMTDNIINNIIIKNNDEFVDSSMNLPNLNQILIKCLTPKTLDIVRNFVDDDIINMLNAGNIQDAVTKLNCNVETSENILEVITKKIKKELFNKQAELEYEQKRIPDDKKTHDEKLKKINEKISSLTNQLDSIEQRIKTFKEENCPICFMDFDSPMMTNCCNQFFCVQCLTLCKICPMCRKNIDLTKCVVINDNKPETKTMPTIKEEIKEHVLFSKVDNLINLLKAKPKGKFLLFSNYDQTFENLKKKLSDENIAYNKLIGSNVVINSIIRKFESNEIRVLMLNASNYGSGLNLQMATDIIIYHELDIELETQVIGRAQRLGRKIPLNVYYLLNDNEKINCKNPTLNLDIFEDDMTMLNNFVNNKIKLSDDINTNNELINSDEKNIFNSDEKNIFNQNLIAKSKKKIITKKNVTDSNKKKIIKKKHTIEDYEKILHDQKNINTNAINELQQPIKINELQQPIKINELQQPDEINELQQPIKINELQQPDEINNLTNNNALLIPVENVKIIKKTLVKTNKTANILNDKLKTEKTIKIVKK